jgi:hypothetical protein
MANKSGIISAKDQAWIEARRRHRLSHAHVQMARELGLNPKKLGGIDNHRQEPWKVPLHQFIEQLYLERFGRERPAVWSPYEGRRWLSTSTTSSWPSTAPWTPASSLSCEHCPQERG